MLGRRRRRRNPLGELAETMRADMAEALDFLELELALLAAEVDAGMVPPGARRARLPHEVDAGTNFAAIAADVERTVDLVVRRLHVDRARYLGLLEAYLRDAVAAAGTDPAGAIARALTEVTAAPASIPGAPALIAEAQAGHLADLGALSSHAGAAVLDEARGQAVAGVPGPGAAGLDDDALGRLEASAGRLATQPLADMVRHVADAVYRLPLAAMAPGAAVKAAVGAGRDAPARSLPDYARQASHGAYNLGRQAGAAVVPAPAAIYASELLDDATCGPCSFIDGTEYASREEAEADYPNGTYADCEGGERCRGTLVYVWGTEAPPTLETPGDRPAPPPAGPPPPELGLEFTRPAPPDPPAPPPVAEPATPAPLSTTDARRAAYADLRAVRASMRAQALTMQREAWGQLEGADAVKLDPPPARRSRAERDAAKARGEWDWFYELHPEEQRRLRRNWFNRNRDQAGVSGPDAVADRIAAALGLVEPTTDEAMAAWVGITRRADAGGWMGRGRMPLPDAYGGLAPRELLGETGPYDPGAVFDQDIAAAAAHVATAQADDAVTFAERELVDRGTGYPPAWTMTRQDYVAELELLDELTADMPEVTEWETRDPLDQRTLDRYDELVPASLEGQGLPAAELYDRVLELARLAGKLPPVPPA